MEFVTSADRTRIAFERSGSGPPLVLVHGTSSSCARWRPLLPALGERYTIYAMERRGRGESGDAADYAIEREFEDVAAVVDAISEPVNLFGHSFGALCALEAALLTSNISKLLLYEPALPVVELPFDDVAMYTRLQRLLDAGDHEDVIITFYREVVGLSEDELAFYRGLPTWSARVAAAHTIVRECWAEHAYQYDAGRFAQLEVPTLLLLGSDSPDWLRRATFMVDEALPDSRIVELAGQQHIAMDTAPALFTRELLVFLEEPARVS
jgi:pimeloyl-ACP methyl ester carboxylesterase